MNAGTNPMSCTEFEALLAEAVEGALPAATRQAFQGHAQACSVCGPLLSEAEVGLRWLKALPQAEAPERLISNILLATIGAESARAAAQPASRSWLRRLRDWAAPLVSPGFEAMWQPRFAMSLAMAFFSVSLVTNVLVGQGLSWSQLRRVDLRPSAIRSSLVRQYNETTASVVKYYENIRFVYEIQSRVQELREAAAPAQPPAAQPSQPDKTEDNTGRQPERDGSERYSQEQMEMRLARLLAPAPYPAERLQGPSARFTLTTRSRA